MEAYSAIWAVIYLLFVYFVFQRELAFGRLAKYMILYGSLAVVFELINAVKVLGWLGVLGHEFWSWQRYFGVLFLSVFFLALSMEFFNSQRRYLLWLVIPTSWAALLVVLILGPLKSIDFNETWKQLFILGCIFIGWVTVITVRGYLNLVAFTGVSKPLHKNRIAFWGTAVLVMTLGEGLIIIGQDFIGSILRIVAVLVAGYVVFFHDLVDLAGAIQKLPVIAYKMVVAFILYATVISIRLPGGIFENNSHLFEIAFKAFILVVGINPILTLFNQYIDRALVNSGYSQSSVVREYNLAIAQIVDLHRLAEVALNEIIQVFRIQHARLYLVDRAEDEGCFYLRQVLPYSESSGPQPEPGKLRMTGPIVDHFNQKQKPLTQYELDFSPKFSSIEEKEKVWLSRQQVDLYIPIRTLDTWIGLFALGPKRSGSRFFPEDLELLNTLAEQTVIGLQNARLFEDLLSTQEMLKHANQKLRSLDEMKSAFISVVTHELRTPIANISFSLQVLELYGNKNLLPEQHDQIKLLAKSILSARQMVDSLVTYASFLNEQMQINLELLDFRELVQGVMPALRQDAEIKGLTFSLDLPGDTFFVNGDRRLLQIAVHHLVENSVRFTQTGSIWVTCWMLNDALCFDVQDSGAGIPSERVSDIWEAFSQASSDPIRRGVEGLGLGLALVKLIVQAHGGFVWVESKVNYGSFFGFQIPLAGPAKPLDEVRARNLRRSSLERSVTW